MSNHVLLTTLGSLGDLFPVLSLAQALEARGQTTLLALEEADAERATRLGLNAVPFGPSRAEITAQTGLSEEDFAAMVFRDPSPVVDKLIMPRLAQATRALAPHATGARAVCGTLLGMAAPFAAEVAGAPFVPVLLQPMVLASARAPSRVRLLRPPMVAQAEGGLALAWNTLVLRTAFATLRLRHSKGLNAVRAEVGLPPTRAVPLFERAQPDLVQLGLWDSGFAPPAPDAPKNLVVCGFPPPLATGALDPALSAFLDAGPAPLVVTLGSIAHTLGGRDFWARAVRLARGAGLRAVLINGAAPAPSGGDIFQCAFAPHGPLFARAAAVLHHGGIGTTTAALRARVPQLIHPIGADQPDNAERVTALGMGARLPRRIDSARAEAMLRDLLHRPMPHVKFDTDGAAVAADRLLACLAAARR